jgi:hypothetical protein
LFLRHYSDYWLLKAWFERYDVKGGKDFGQWEKEINGCMLVAFQATGLLATMKELLTFIYITRLTDI